MMRVKTSNVRRKYHKKVLKQAKSFFSKRSTAFRIANEAVETAKTHRTRSRRTFKRDIKKTWIDRINKFSRTINSKYSDFIYNINKRMNTKNLSYLISLKREDILKKLYMDKNFLK